MDVYDRKLRSVYDAIDSRNYKVMSPIISKFALMPVGMVGQEDN